MKTPAQGRRPRRSTWRPRPSSSRCTGRYFADSPPKRSSVRSYDEAIAVRLWQVSAVLVGLTATPRA